MHHLTQATPTAEIQTNTTITGVAGDNNSDDDENDDDMYVNDGNGTSNKTAGLSTNQSPRFNEGERERITISNNVSNMSDLGESSQSDDNSEDLYDRQNRTRNIDHNNIKFNNDDANVTPNQMVNSGIAIKTVKSARDRIGNTNNTDFMPTQKNSDDPNAKKLTLNEEGAGSSVVTGNENYNSDNENPADDVDVQT